MALLNWLKQLFAPKLKRDISRLSQEDDEDLVTELVNTSDRPLKEHHRRRAFRDKRLLPKPKPPLAPFVHRKRKKWMSANEAGRLFGATLRTRSRELRDLLTDEDQLARYGLPVWRNEDELANALGISIGLLRFFSIHREKELAPHYVTFAIPKRSGGERLILAPKRRLKAIQRKLLKLLVEKLPVSDYSHGFRLGRSVRTCAEPHVGKAIVVGMDLKDFFPSVTFVRVRGMLIAFGYSYPVAATLAALMTESERQPVEVEGKVYHVPVGERHCVQGAPTSPGICNVILLRLDRRLGGLAKKFGVEYTRYADDLTFSGAIDHRAAHGLCKRVEQVIVGEGFAVNRPKTRIIGKGRRQTITGVVVNQELGLSRKVRRQLRAAAHRMEQQQKRGVVDAGQMSKIRGKAAYLSMLNSVQAAPLYAALARLKSIP